MEGLLNGVDCQLRWGLWSVEEGSESSVVSSYREAAPCYQNPEVYKGRGLALEFRAGSWSWCSGHLLPSEEELGRQG